MDPEIVVSMLQDVKSHQNLDGCFCLLWFVNYFSIKIKSNCCQYIVVLSPLNIPEQRPNDVKTWLYCSHISCIIYVLILFELNPVEWWIFDRF